MNLHCTLITCGNQADSTLSASLETSSVASTESSSTTTRSLTDPSEYPSETNQAVKTVEEKDNGHKQSPASKIKKSFACQHCQKVFNRPSALQTHIYTHTGERPFKCSSPNCSRSFSVVSNLRRHFKIHQKLSNDNKLSPEDRVRCVKKLMQKTDCILTDMRANKDYEVETGPKQRRSISQEKSSVKHYRHYFILPATNGHQNNVYPDKDIHNSPVYIENGLITMNPFVQVPPAYYYDSTADSRHAYESNVNYSYSNPLAPFVSFGLTEYNNLQYSANDNYILQSALRRL